MIDRRLGLYSGLLGASALLLAGCMDHPPPPRHPGPYNEPVDAFNAIQESNVYSGPTGAHGDQLGNDLHHLHDAREAYNLSQERQAADLRRSQAACKAQDGAREVAIQDGTDDPDATYCQQPASGEQ